MKENEELDELFEDSIDDYDWEIMKEFDPNLSEQ